MIRLFITFLVYTNIWIAAGAACLSWMFHELVGVRANLFVVFFVFFATLLTYTFQRYMKLIYRENIQGPRMYWMQDNPLTVRALLLLGAAGTVAFGLTFRLSSILTLGIAGLISFFYAFKFGKGQQRTNLRDIPGIKIFLIGLVWALSCAIIPAIELNMLSVRAFSIATGFLLYIISITIPFDIRDIDVDEVNKRTIPQLIGVNASKILGVGLAILSYVLMTYPAIINWPLIIGILITSVCILLSKTESDELYYSFIMDGLLILLPASYFLLS